MFLSVTWDNISDFPNSLLFFSPFCFCCRELGTGRLSCCGQLKVANNPVSVLIMWQEQSWVTRVVLDFLLLLSVFCTRPIGSTKEGSARISPWIRMTYSWERMRWLLPFHLLRMWGTTRRRQRGSALPPDTASPCDDATTKDLWRVGSTGAASAARPSLFFPKDWKERSLFIQTEVKEKGINDNLSP